eukprot:gene25253-10901_t
MNGMQMQTSNGFRWRTSNKEQQVDGKQHLLADKDLTSSLQNQATNGQCRTVGIYLGGRSSPVPSTRCSCNQSRAAFLQKQLGQTECQERTDRGKVARKLSILRSGRIIPAAQLKLATDIFLKVPSRWILQLSKSIRSKGTMEFEAARNRIARSKDLLNQYKGTAIPAETTLERVAAAMASATTIWEVLWDVTISLEERLTKIETELASLITDHNKLVLRSMSSQLSNKLARHCVDGISSPYAARHTTLQRIKDHKKQNARLGPLLSKYPDLADGVEALNELGIPIAHPERLRVAEGSPQAVMHEVLTTLINIHFDESDMLEPVRQVMQCLEHLSSELGEPLFIDTHTKP